MINRQGPVAAAPSQPTASTSLELSFSLSTPSIPTQAQQATTSTAAPAKEVAGGLADSIMTKMKENEAQEKKKQEEKVRRKKSQRKQKGDKDEDGDDSGD